MEDYLAEVAAAVRRARGPFLPLYGEAAGEQTAQQVRQGQLPAAVVLKLRVR